MHKTYHIQMTERALKNSFSARALTSIITANVNQDAILNLLKGRFHFDANEFEKAKLYVLEQDDILLSNLASGNTEEAWQAFGRKTHALQDFYAHTNYVALWIEKNPAFVLENGEFVLPLEPALIDSDKLHAAKVYYPIEALTIFPSLMPLMKRILPADSHANMNLDSPESGPLFPLAISAATRRTEIYYEEICEKISNQHGTSALYLFLDKMSV